MSINTIITMIKKNERLDIHNLHSKKNYYYSSDSPTWGIIALDGWEKEHQALAKTLSDDQQTDTIYLSINDFYWEAIFFRAGSQVSWLKLDYINAKKSMYLNVDELLALANDQQEANILGNDLRDMQLHKRNVHIQAPFEIAFGLPAIEGMIYDKIWASEDIFEAELNMIHIEMKKTIKPSNTIISLLELNFQEKGYSCELNYQGDKRKVAFRKNMDGFWYIIVFDTGDKNKISMNYLAPFGSVVWDEFTYSNILELRKGLLKAWNEVLEEKVIAMELERLEPFEPEHVYAALTDPFMASYQYERTRMDPNLLHKNGEVEYRHSVSGDIIIFRHFFLMIDLKLTHNGLPYDYRTIINQNRSLFKFQLTKPFGFRNEREFRGQIEILMNILAVCFDAS